MEREQANAIISLARNADWKPLMSYVEDVVMELQASLAYVDPTDSMRIAKTQGSISALIQVLKFEEDAQTVIGGNDE